MHHLNWWSDKNFLLLFELTAALDIFLWTVRREWDPKYFSGIRKFPLRDSMGYRNGGVPCDYNPTKHQIVRDLRKLHIQGQKEGYLDWGR